MTSNSSATGFPASSQALESFGYKFTGGGAHISRTLMLTELEATLRTLPDHAPISDYGIAINGHNILGKATDSTRLKSFRHLRELYSLDLRHQIFGLLRQLYAVDTASLPLLAIQVAWARDPLLRATTQSIMNTKEGERVPTSLLTEALQAAFPDQYSDLNLSKIARNASSSWSQSGHLRGRKDKVRSLVKPTAVSTTMALYLGNVAGYYGAEVFSNPWCRLIDLDSDRARLLGLEAHRAGLLTLRSVGDVVELTFPTPNAFSEHRS